VRDVIEAEWICVVITLWSHIAEALGSHLGKDTGYTSFRGFTQSPGRIPDSTSIRLRLLSSRLFPIHRLTLCSLDTESVAKEPTKEEKICHHISYSETASVV
jgi:hypothetical protein